MTINFRFVFNFYITLAIREENITYIRAAPHLYSHLYLSEIIYFYSQYINKITRYPIPFKLSYYYSGLEAR